MNKALLVVTVVAIVLLVPDGRSSKGGGIGTRCVAQTTDPPPGCTNADCPPDPGCTNADCPPDPGCTNADCPPDPGCTNADCPPDPGCTNADCPPPEPTGDCCCVGDNQPGDIRVCCCRSGSGETVNCRQSLVLETGYPHEWHQTLAEVTLDGRRPKGCDTLLKKFCDPPDKEVCRKEKGKMHCKKMVKAVCEVLDKACRYRFCGPNWFPYEEPAPDLASCGWWNRIHPCRFK